MLLLAAALLGALPFAAAGGDCASCQPDRRWRPPPPFAYAGGRTPSPPGGGNGTDADAVSSDSEPFTAPRTTVLGLHPFVFTCLAACFLVTGLTLCACVRRRLMARDARRLGSALRVRVLLEAAARAAAVNAARAVPGAVFDASLPFLGMPLLAHPWPPVRGTPAPLPRTEVTIHPPSATGFAEVALQPWR
jgi:hypothetical protein